MRYVFERRFLAAASSLLLAGPLTGQLLTPVEREASGPLDAVADVAFAHDDQVVLVVSNDDALASYGRDGSTGELQLADQELDGVAGVDGLRRPTQLAISPSGGHAYVSSRMDDAVAVFAVTAAGDLQFVQAAMNETGGIEGLWQAKGVAVSPDGAYVVSSGRRTPAQPKGAVTLFTRDGGTGTIAFADLIEDDSEPGLSELGQGGRVHFSPDGAYLYVCVPGTGAVVVFSIDAQNDQLVFEGQVVDGQGGVSGIAGASWIAFGADGADAYVTGATGGSLAHFARNGATGQLAFVTAFADGVGGVDGLAGAAHAVVNPAGDRLYVAGATDAAVAVFARDAQGGLLYIGLRRDDPQEPLDALVGVLGLAVTGDGEFAYSAAAGEDAVGVYRRGGAGGSEALDFGDAPEPPFPTLFGADGARHVIVDGSLRLGDLLDAEADAHHDASATADDTDLVDDEDGVEFVEALIPGQAAVVEVTASAPGLLDAWIDWNGDGDWSDASERIASGAALVAGANPVNVAVPLDSAAGGTVVSRFRLSSAGVAAPTGEAADGEVEDHLAAIGEAADLGVAGDASVSDWGQPYTLTITVTNHGPSPVAAGDVTIVLSANANAPTWTCVATGGTCGAGGVGDVNDTITLGADGTAIYTFSGTVVVGDPGPTIEGAATVVSTVFDPLPGNNAAVATVMIQTIFLGDFESGDTSLWSSTVP